MNINEIKDSVVLYSDRSDLTDAAFSTFIQVVESRVNRALQTRNQSKSAFIATSIDVYRYALPDDFAGMRDVSIATNLCNDKISLDYVAPSSLNHFAKTQELTNLYSIVGNELHLSNCYEGKLIEIIYYQRIRPLTTSTPNNWLSDKYPEVYIQGIMVEVSSFAKDPESAQLWETRFTSSLDQMQHEDSVDRWSGPTMSVKVLP